MRVRLALETYDRIGTSGTLPWAMMRFALERAGTTVCVTAPAQLVYVGSHHNCSDKATVTAGTVRYELTAPDRATTILTAYSGTTVVWGPTTVTNTSCVSTNQCASGGPCM